MKMNTMSNESGHERITNLPQDPGNFVSVTNCESPENFNAMDSKSTNKLSDQVTDPLVPEAHTFTLAKKRRKKKKSPKKKKEPFRINYLDPLLHDNQPVLFEGYLVPMSCNALDPNWLEKYMSGT